MKELYKLCSCAGVYLASLYANAVVFVVILHVIALILSRR